MTDIQPPPPPLYTLDESLAPGQIKQVDWEVRGMTVNVTRTIIEGGATRTETLTSKYQPWRAIYLVGSQADMPAAAGNATQSVATEEETATEEAPILEPTPTVLDGPSGPDQ